jgi:uncharacterized protein (DUF2147 family)
MKSKIMGLEILSNLEYDDGQWVNGKIYSPRNGKTVNCKIKISENNQELYLTASKGWLFSKTVVWTRVSK